MKRKLKTVLSSFIVMIITVLNCMVSGCIQIIDKNGRMFTPMNMLKL